MDNKWIVYEQDWKRQIHTRPIIANSPTKVGLHIFLILF